MDRQAHDYATAMAFVQQQQQTTNIQQQQQFGFHQQFPPSVHGPPFLPPHPSLQQCPFPRHMQQPHQLHPHPPPHPHLLHLQQQQQSPPVFPPHMPHHLVPSPFIGPYDSPPHPAAPPSDPKLQKRIDKLVEYAAKNGPEFEAIIREKQQDNPDYSFLFGGEGHNYYRYKLWLSTHGPGGPFNPPFPSSSMPMMRPPNLMMNQSSLNAPRLGGPQMHQPPFTPPFYEQQQHHQHSQPFVGHGRPDYDHSSRSFKGLSGPLPSDVAMEMNNVLNNLTGTKESIKGAKIWFIQRSPFAPALAEALRDRVFGADDSERQLHIIYLANDILFDRLQRRINPHELDNEALAFKPVLGSMLARIYHNPQNKEENQSRLQKILQFWASKEVYDHVTSHALENEMIGSGKTYTMKPLPLKASRDILKLMHHTYWNQGFQLFFSFFEIYIYGGKIFDLLSDRKKLCTREDGKQQVCIVGLQQCKVSDVETIQELIENGNATRSAGTTGAKEESSRSHAILQLAIQRSADGSESKPPRVVGKLSFIDLAGSE